MAPFAGDVMATVGALLAAFAIWGRAIDASLALEFLGFRLADAKEGLASAREKRPPRFERKSPL